MAQIADNKATEFVYGGLFGYNFEDQDIPGKEDMEKLNCVSNFAEYVYKHAARCGYNGDSADIAKIAEFVANLCSKASVELGSGTKKTIERWLKNGLPSNDANGRENIYRLCFALKMNGYQTVEFFLKAYMERPFNYKNIHEAVYFFCMNNNLTYKDAVRIISEVEHSSEIENPYADNVTEQIGAHIATLQDEAALVKYLVENWSGFQTHNQTATEKIRQLVKHCMLIAPKEYEAAYESKVVVKNEDDSKIVVKNEDDLLQVIYGYAARAKEENQNVHKKSISKSNFPDLVKRNWPQREQFQQILQKGTASYDTIRRALIMLVFYDFFASAVVAQKEAEHQQKLTGREMSTPAVENGLFDEFETEANTILSECGYVQLYWRNPYDWMIGYCAQALDPIGQLRDLIEEYYLSDEAVCDQPNALTEAEIIEKLSHNW